MKLLLIMEKYTLCTWDSHTSISFCVFITFSLWTFTLLHFSDQIIKSEVIVDSSTVTRSSKIFNPLIKVKKPESKLGILRQVSIFHLHWRLQEFSKWPQLPDRWEISGFVLGSSDHGFRGRVFGCPKNHRISKLMIWTSQNPAIQSQTCRVILREKLGTKPRVSCFSTSGDLRTSRLPRDSKLETRSKVYQGALSEQLVYFRRELHPNYWKPQWIFVVR